MSFMQGSPLYRDNEAPANDERQAALRYLLDAWEEAVFDGVDPDNPTFTTEFGHNPAWCALALLRTALWSSH